MRAETTSLLDEWSKSPMNTFLNRVDRLKPLNVVCVKTWKDDTFGIIVYRENPSTWSLRTLMLFDYSNLPVLHLPAFGLEQKKAAVALELLSCVLLVALRGERRGMVGRDSTAIKDRKKTKSIQKAFGTDTDGEHFS